MEKGTNNFNDIRIYNYNRLSEEKIKEIIQELEKNSIIDNYKFKIYELENEISNQINTLKFNCYNNNFIKIDNEEKIEMDKYIKNLVEKFYILKENEILDNKDFDDKILNYKRIIKLNKNRYNLLFDKLNCFENNNNYNYI